MRTAREGYLAHPTKAEFAKMAETVVFDTAAEYALAVFAEELPATGDPNAAWTAHAQLVGARNVLRVLRTLHLPAEAPKPIRFDNLKSPS